MNAVSSFIGGLIATAVLTLIFHWLLRNHAAPIPRLLMANGLSLFVATVLAGFGFAGGGEPKFARRYATCMPLALAAPGTFLPTFLQTSFCESWPWAIASLRPQQSGRMCPGR